MESVPFSLSEQLIYYGVAILYLLKTTYPLMVVQKIKKTMKRFVPHFPIYVVAAFLLIAVISLSGCSQNELPGGDDNDTLHSTALTVQVTDGGYSPAEGTHPDTRATENGYTTVFTEGDRIGLYAVKNGAIVASCANLCLTLTDDGNGNLSWTLPTGSELWYEGASAGITYHAYYPYQSDADMTGKVAPAANANGFFDELEEMWSPATDQSTPAAYTAQDLMTGIGTVSSNGSARTLTFNLTHQMALAVIKTPITKYVLTDKDGQSLPDYFLSAPALTFDGFAPCAMSAGSYRYLVNPSLNQSQSQLSGSYTNASGKTQEFLFTPEITTGTYKNYTVDGGSATVTEKSHTLQVGDFYMSDGSLVGKDEDLTDAQQAACLGVVFYVDDPTNSTDGDPLLKSEHAACTHGLVVALNDASSGTLWSSDYEDISNNWLNSQSSIYHISLKTTNKMQGYANTRALSGYNASDRVTGTPSRKVLPIQAVKDYSDSHTAPANSSGWYFLSIMELKYICWGQGASSGTAGKGMLREQFGKVKGASPLQSYDYWSSTEYDGSRAWCVYFPSGGVYYDSRKRSSSFRVRAVLAF